MIRHLRNEAEKLLLKDKDDIINKLSNLNLSQTDNKDPVLKLKWPKNCSKYDRETLHKIFSKYGVIENVVIKRSSAVIEFECLESACIAAKAEESLESSPLSLKPLFSAQHLTKPIFVRYDCVSKWPCSLDKALIDTEKYIFKKLTS